jgi:N-acetylneuraminic acid mutarotase
VKKQSTSQSAFLGLRFSIILVLYAAVACSVLTVPLLAFFRSEEPAKFSQRTLTFEERVSYQRAIEEVYWRHRIWPGERPDPKPPLDAVMSQAELEKKVQDYLRESQALENYRQRPITSEQLQDEMDRMAQHTKQPEVLRELFGALGNNPFVIAECLARPVLAERLFKSALAPQYASEVGKPIKSVKINSRLLDGYTLPVITTTLKVEGTCNDAWAATSTLDPPTAREWYTSIWTGTEMIIWGGWDGSNYLNTGGKYDPSTDSWTAITTANAPAARSTHTAVWTGSQMIVWGGVGTGGTVLNTGARYNPVTNNWAPTSTNNAPVARDSHTAVWTDSEMVVWGGWATNPLSTGGRYNPITDTWTDTSTTNAPSARYYHTAVRSGNEMIVWGGEDFAGAFNTGGRYNPGADSWTATSTTNAPSARIAHTTVWTGSEMVVWGGYNGTELNTGGRYNPTANTWVATSLTNAPTRREGHTAVWTDSEMIVWAGYDGFNNLNTGARYDPGVNSWVASSTINAPSARDAHTAVWSGNEMIVWGGIDAGGLTNTGGRYCGQYPSPTPTPTPTASPTPTATPSGVYEAWVARYNGPGHAALDIVKSMALDSKGNVYITGSSYTDSVTDYTTVKYNGSGQQQWVARYHGPGNYGVADAIAVDAAGNVFVTGGITLCQNDSAWATTKYDSAGQQQWVVTYSGDAANAIGIDASGNVYVTGGSDGLYTTIKYDGSGKEQWISQGPNGVSVRLALDSSGNTYVTGSSGGLYTTVKYKASGQQEWVVPGPSGDPAGMVIDTLGNVYVTGTTHDPGGNDDYGTIKYNSSGEQQWLATYNGPANNLDDAKAIAVDSSGNVYITGESFDMQSLSDYATIKYNSLGEQQWVARYDGDNSWDNANAIAVDAANNVYVTGNSLVNGREGYATIKYNQSGQEEWVIHYETLDDSSDDARAISLDSGGNFYVTGVGAGLKTNFDYVTIKYGQGVAPTPTPTATASPTATATVTPTATPTASPGAPPVCSPTPTTPPPTPMATATATPTSTPAPRPRPSPRPRPAPRPRPTPL